MSEICPICNGLYEKTMICSKCRSIMDQAGTPEDYYGPYSPFVGKDTFLLNNTATGGDRHCVHLYVCPNCSSLQYGTVPLISM